ncbi:(2Fe-2S)-binding protein [Algiphilus aromaticivorans]|uniref:(2Fe-2S)-binding protein n=1 Tax=Algiphilus aromaticivorans TaxID=382454 RepID=UPI0018DC8764|nr:(2Fe-2S)-binding protein [Algiphilus aromaticivorans]
MIVCSCKRVREAQLRALAEARTSDGVVRLGDAVRELGLGTGCGRCLRHARRVMDAVAEREAEAELLPVVRRWAGRQQAALAESA